MTFRRIFGEDGDFGTSASSKVVTSETLVTAMIFSAATSRKVLAIRLAWLGSLFLTVMDTIRVSVGTETLTDLLNSAVVPGNFNSEITVDNTSCDKMISL